MKQSSNTCLLDQSWIYFPSAKGFSTVIISISETNICTPSTKYDTQAKVFFVHVIRLVLDF